ncbi:MAG: NAD(P)H-dependent oxidoreductase [Verrucomicrobiae bacterium]|nr:NAD(P)H-dependent oxidoreductase [Verrucomicrobiae bacterium]NNJ43452.1 NAD(P)H-dependent oxidoreductase [Akkermansiaceae bacterium]
MTLSPEDLIKSLQWRYATKEFDAEKKIPENIWATLEQSLLLTPSSFGLQPWKFITITDQGVKNTLLEHSWGQPQVTHCSHMVVLCAKEEMTHDDIEAWLDRLVEVRGISRDHLNDYASMMHGFFSNMDAAKTLSWAKNQVYIALGQLMASAAVIGIDACPLEGIAPPEYDRILGLENTGYATTVGCAVGYRSHEDKYASLPKVRYTPDQVLRNL